MQLNHIKLVLVFPTAKFNSANLKFMIMKPAWHE